jgi:LysM repeat protein
MNMKKLLPIALVSSLILMALVSCSLTSAASEDEIAMATPTLMATTIKLGVQTDASALTAVGQVIKYIHTVKNKGAAAVQGPLTVTGAVCPEINSIGNMDANFDVDEVITCTSEYIVTQADLDRGSVTTIMIATASGVNSNTVTTTISKAAPVLLSLSKTANPGTYDQVGQVITYTYVILNNGATNLGPGQFIVTDAGFSSPINCGEATASLAPAATLSCTINYSISQADVDAGSVSTKATASISGLADSQPVSVTLTKGSVAAPTSSTLIPGSTIQHKVKSGEWLLQIARCYGADTAKVLQSNSQLDDPGDISPDMIITVPNIGSAGKIYGPPCVTTHTVQSGDTWASIALKYNADVAVLKKVNKNVLEVGQVLNVPLNSAGLSQ